MFAFLIMNCLKLLSFIIPFIAAMHWTHCNVIAIYHTTNTMTGGVGGNCTTMMMNEKDLLTVMKG
jgi:hypothetical protein